MQRSNTKTEFNNNSSIIWIYNTPQKSKYKTKKFKAGKILLIQGKLKQMIGLEITQNFTHNKLCTHPHFIDHMLNTNDWTN